MFIHGFNSLWINSVVPGGWSIAIEMMFYIFVPFLFKKITSLNQAVILFILSIIMTIVLNLFINQPQNLYYYYWFFNQINIFFLGFVLYFIIKDSNQHKSNFVYATSLLSSIIVMILLSFIVDKIWFMRHIVYGLLLMNFSYCTFKLCKSKLVNKYVVNLGKVSYSCYLIHFAILSIIDRSFMIIGRHIGVYSSVGLLMFLLKFILTLVLTYVVAIFTYKFLENPFIQFSRNLIKKRESNIVES